MISNSVVTAKTTAMVAVKRQDAASTAAWAVGRLQMRNTLRAATRVADTERETQLMNFRVDS